MSKFEKFMDSLVGVLGIFYLLFMTIIPWIDWWMTNKENNFAFILGCIHAFTFAAIYMSNIRRDSVG